jgi:hypothetical protein
MAWRSHDGAPAVNSWPDWMNYGARTIFDHGKVGTRGAGDFPA